MKSYLYFLWHHTQQYSQEYSIFKIGSTKNLLKRMMNYKTSFLEFVDNKKTKLFIIEIDDNIRNAYYFDELLKELTKSINVPYCNTYYNGSTGGIEFYRVTKKESNDFKFILSVINELIVKVHNIKKIKIEDLFKENIITKKEVIEQVYEDTVESNKVLKDLLRKDLEIIMNKYCKVEKQSLRNWQMDCLNKIFDMHECSGVVIAPTGTGKSYLIIELMSRLLSLGKKILYLTKRKEVLSDMFKRAEKNIKKKNLKVIQNKKDLKYDICFMNFGKIENENNKLKVEDFKGIYDFILIDECHWSGSPKAFKFLEELKKGVEKLIGFSATPLRLTGQNQQNNFNIFGSGTDLNIIYQLSYLDAIENNYIMSLERRLMLIDETEVYEKEIEDNEEEYETKITVKSLNDNGKIKLLKELDDLISKSTYKKCIIYFGNTEQLIKFRKFYVKNKNKFINLNKLKLFESYVKDKETELAPQKFKKENSNAMLFVIKRCAEGFDDPKLEVGALGYVAKSYDPILLIQREGRLSRILDKKITPSFITLVYNDNSEDFVNNLVMNMAKLVKSFNLTNSVKSNNDLDEIYKRFNELVKINGELKISKEDFNRRVFNLAYGSENMRVKRYLVDMNLKLYEKNNELICTKNKIINHLKTKGEKFIPAPKNGNWVRYAIGNNLFEVMKNKYYYTKEEIREACHKLNIYDFDDYKEKWMNDTKLPNEEWINKGGFYYDMDEKFNIQDYFVKNKFENIDSF